MIKIDRLYLIALSLLLFVTKSFSQVCGNTGSSATLTVNGVSCDILNIGILWNEKYNVPLGGFGSPPPPSVMSSCGLMVAGKTSTGNLKIAAQQSLTSGGLEYSTGPLDSLGNVTRNVCSNFDKLFEVNNSDLQTFLSSNGRTIPNSLRGWPGKGNPLFRSIHGFDLPTQNLAPFVDANGDGIYNPENGDYPAFCGDYAYWWIFNDKGKSHTGSNGGTPLGIEVKGMAYGYEAAATDTALKYSTMYNYEIVYKGTEILDSAYVALWIDADIGCNEDDYFGCSPSNNMAFAYNADSKDGSGGFCGSSAEKSYNDHIPVVGVKFLETPKGSNGQELGMTNFMYYYTDAGTVPYPTKAGKPQTPNEHYNIMTGRWRDGSPLTYGGDGTSTTNTPTKFAYPAVPNNTDTINWNMPNSRANTTEKAMIMSCGPFRMLPNSRHRLAFAVITDVDVAGHPRPSINNLITKANRLRNICSFPTSINDAPNESPIVKIVPNPVFDEANIHYSGSISKFSIYNLAGQLVSETQAVNSSFLKFSTQTMLSGIYIYKITDNNGKSSSGRFTVIK